MSLRVIEKNLGKSEEMKIKEVEMYIEEGKNLLFEIEKSVNMFEHAQMVIDIGKLCEKYKDFVDKGIRIKKLTQKLRRSDYVRNEKCMPQLDQKVIKCFSPKISNIQASNKVVIKKEDLVIVFV
ncbi:unnamed protein product [Blepharisma stoltei]|uniref:Uncharacterized protein n=1 Tax=Blepharisma stoltei TaxID=1481888 RepID=A0AAU9JHV1_9CILI|nr:unnamed protein product [Blepharisma stoltei]